MYTEDMIDSSLVYAYKSGYDIVFLQIRGRGYAFYDSNLVPKHPRIAKEWHPTKNDQLKPVDYRPGSGKIIWWKCSKGNHHDWKARIIDRTKNNYPSRCPFCSGRKSLIIERKELG